MLKNASILSIGNVIVMALGFVSLKLTISILSSDEFGMFGYWMALFGLAFLFVDAGLSGAHLKRISEGRDAKDCFKVYLTLTLLLIFMLSIVAIIVLEVLGPEIVGITDVAYLPVFCLLFSAWSITILYQGVARSFVGLRLPIKQISTDLIRSITLVLLLWGVSVNSGGFAYLAIAYLLAACVGLFVSLWLSRFLWGGKWFSDLFMSYLSFSRANFFNLVVQTAAKNLDTIIVGTYLGTSELAVYYGSKRVISLLDPLVSALSMSIFPVISSLSAKDNLQGIRDTISRFEHVSVIVIAFMFGFVFFQASSILTLVLGDDFSSQPYVFVGLFAGAAISTVGLGYTFAPGAMGRPDVTFRNAGSALLGWLLLCFILVPEHVFGIPVLGLGLAGVVVAYIAYWIIWTTLDRVVLRKWVGTRLRVSLLGIVLIGLISASMGWALVPVGTTFVETALLLVLAGLVTGCTYLGCLLAFGIVRIQDIEAIFRRIQVLF